MDTKEGQNWWRDAKVSAWTILNLAGFLLMVFGVLGVFAASFSGQEVTSEYQGTIETRFIEQRPFSGPSYHIVVDVAGEKYHQEVKNWEYYSMKVGDQFDWQTMTTVRPDGLLDTLLICIIQMMFGILFFGLGWNL